MTIILGMLCSIISAFSQVTIGQIEKDNEYLVQKPPVYDSLVDFSYFDKYKTYEGSSSYDSDYPKTAELHYKQYIGLKFYLPPVDEKIKPFLFSNHPDYNKQTWVYKPEVYDSSKNSKYDYKSRTLIETPIIFFTNSLTVYDNYYTLLNVYSKLQAKEIWESMKKESSAWNNSYDNKYFEGIYYSGWPDFIFEFKSDSNDDTVFTISYQNSFILVPYFLKQKELYESKNLICFNGKYSTFQDIKKETPVSLGHETKWFCKEVTLLKQKDVNAKTDNKESISDYRLFYVLTNEKGETVTLNNLKGTNYYFIYESEYLKSKEKEKIEQQKQLAYQKEKEKQRIEKEKLEREKFKEFCIQKFGEINGNLIFQGKVKIGMTKEMCETAWGKSLRSSKTTTEHGTIEILYYGYGYSLYFENDILKIINE